MKTKTSKPFNLKLNFLKILLISIGLVTFTGFPVFAEQHITFEKTLDVEKTLLQETLIDVKNYKKVFPDFVRTVGILEKSEDKVLTEMSLGFGMIPMMVKTEHNILSENTNEMKIISGELQGTEITTTLKKTWGFDGMPDQGTIVQLKISLRVSGFLALMGIIDENIIHNALDDSLFRIQEFSNGNFVGEIEQHRSVQKKR